MRIFLSLIGILPFATFHYSSPFLHDMILRSPEVFWNMFARSSSTACDKVVERLSKLQYLCPAPWSLGVQIYCSASNLAVSTNTIGLWSGEGHWAGRMIFVTIHTLLQTGAAPVSGLLTLASEPAKQKHVVLGMH